MNNFQRPHMSTYNNSWNRNQQNTNHFSNRKYNAFTTSRHIKKMPITPGPGPAYNLPGGGRYWCETCDKGFMTKDCIDNHIQRHEKCNIDGCLFVAHPLIITKHIQMQHATGLYKRIGKLDNPEDIKKWREERRRKYPTKETIEKKKAEIKEKINRGEKMGLKQVKQGFRNINKKPEQYNRGKQNNGMGRPNRNLANKSKTPTNSFFEKKPFRRIVKTTLPQDEKRKLQPFRGIQNLIIEESVEETIEQCNNLFDDEEDMSDKDIKKLNTQPIVCGALSTLMCTYDSSDEEIEVDSKKKLPTENNTSRISSKIKEQNSDNESGPEETAICKGGQEQNNESKSEKVTKKERHQKLANTTKKTRVVNMKRKLPSTLLEKLLHKEIQHERNVILQCVRYVIKNNYFDK